MSAGTSISSEVGMLLLNSAEAVTPTVPPLSGSFSSFGGTWAQGTGTGLSTPLEPSEPLPGTRLCCFTFGVTGGESHGVARW